jgi:hypothetical protein
MKFAKHWQNHPPHAGNILPNIGKNRVNLPSIGKMPLAGKSTSARSGGSAGNGANAP